MERLVQITLNRFAVSPDGLPHGRGRRSRRREERFDKPPGLGGIKLNLIALIDDLASHFTDVRDDEFSHRASLNRGRFLEQLLVRRRHPGDKSLAFRLFLYHCWHAPNVRLCGIQCKN